MPGILRRVSYLTGANVVNGVLGLVFVPVAVHRLGPDGYGIYSIYAVVLAYAVLAEVGLGRSIIRMVAAEPAADGKLIVVRTGFGMYLVVGVVLLLLAPGIVYALPRYFFPVAPELRSAVAWVGVCALADYVGGIPIYVRQNYSMGEERFGRYSRYVVAAGGLRYGVAFAALLVSSSPVVVAGALALRRLPDLLLARAFMGGLPPGAWRPALDRRTVLPMVRVSAGLSVVQFLQITVVSIGSMLTNWEFGLRGLSVYRAVFDLVSKVWFISNAVGFVIFPRFVRLRATEAGRRVLDDLLPRVLRVSWVSYGLAAVAGGLAGRLVLPAIGLGSGDHLALLLPLAVGVCFNAHGNLAYEFLQATGRYAIGVVLLGGVLGAMLLTFYALARSTGLLAIGWAWVVALATYGTAADLVAYGVQIRNPLPGPREVTARVTLLLGVLGWVWWATGHGPRAAVIGGALCVAAAWAVRHDVRPLWTRFVVAERAG